MLNPEQADDKTRAYIAQLQRDMGLTRHKFGGDPLKFEVIEVFTYPVISVYRGREEIQVGGIGDEYVAQICLVADDVVDVEKWYFDHRPSGTEIFTAMAIERIESYFRHGMGKAETTCRHCGKTVHWTDVKADLLESQWVMFQRQNCGCSS